MSKVTQTAIDYWYAQDVETKEYLKNKYFKGRNPSSFTAGDGVNQKHKLINNNLLKITIMKETLLYGCKIGEPDYMAEILYQCKGYTNKDELLKKGEQWAKLNGYDRLRISIVDLSITPNFTKAINV